MFFHRHELAVFFVHKKISVGAEIISAEQKILKNGFLLFFIKSHMQIYKNLNTFKYFLNGFFVHKSKMFLFGEWIYFCAFLFLNFQYTSAQLFLCLFFFEHLQIF